MPSPPYGGVFTPYQGALIVDLDAARSASDVTPAAILAAIRDRNRAFAIPPRRVDRARALDASL